MTAKRPSMFTVALTVCLAASAVAAPDAEAGALSGAVRKELVRRALARDLARDAATRAVPLAAERSVFRYTTATQARREVASGIGAGSHMTARASAGRPPLASTAQRQYGLPKPPEVRLTVRLAEGTPVKPNKALAGQPGRGELTSPRVVPAEAIRKVVPLKPGPAAP